MDHRTYNVGISNLGLGPDLLAHCAHTLLRAEEVLDVGFLRVVMNLDDRLAVESMTIALSCFALLRLTGDSVVAGV